MYATGFKHMSCLHKDSMPRRVRKSVGNVIDPNGGGKQWFRTNPHDWAVGMESWKKITSTWKQLGTTMGCLLLGHCDKAMRAKLSSSYGDHLKHLAKTRDAIGLLKLIADLSLRGNSKCEPTDGTKDKHY